jgi:hypothetical protein
MFMKRLMQWWRGEEDDVYQHCRCTHCQQKIRYRPEKGGTLSLCPRCRRSIKLPVETETLRRLPPGTGVGHRVVQKY